MALIITVIAIAMVVFHLYTAGFVQLAALQQRPVHLAFALVLTFLIYSHTKKGGRTVTPLDIILILASLACCGNTAFVTYPTLYERFGVAWTSDIILGFILVVLILEMTRRLMGWILPAITLIFIAYGFLGPYIPIPYLSHTGMDISRFIEYQYLSTEGIYTIPLGVSATFVAVFVIFAAFLVGSGVGDFFMDSSKAAAGHMTGGPAKVAVVSSAAMGTISGSAVANVVTTGSVTIPLMKRMGFSPSLAGGVEATASTGGQIMPPLMGAAAFIIASIVGVPYIIVCLACAIPAILYFFSLFLQVHFESTKLGLKGLPREELPRLWPVVKQGAYLMLPLVVLIWLLVSGATAVKAGFYGIVAVVVVSAIRKSTRMGPRKILQAMENGARGILVIASACACSGIIVGILTLTGMGLKLSFLLITISQGILPVLLLLTMAACIVLGMGVTTTAAYILVAILVAPALGQMGVELLPAHIFVFYFAVMSTITPPVCLASYAAAGIAGSDPMRTGFTGWRIGLAGVIVPFFLIYNPQITLLMGDPLGTGWAVVRAIVGVLALAPGVCGYLFRGLKIYHRVILLACIPLLIPPNLLWNIVAVGIIAAIFVLEWLTTRIGSKAGQA